MSRNIAFYSSTLALTFFPYTLFLGQSSKQTVLAEIWQVMSLSINTARDSSDQYWEQEHFASIKLII